MKPMLAQTGDEAWLLAIEADQDWVATRKWDGVRIILTLNNSGNKLLTRSGQNIIGKNPQFQPIIPTLNETILDSEGVTATNYLGDVQSIVHQTAPSTKMQLVLFDCLKYKGESLTIRSLQDRRQYLSLAYHILKSHRWPVRLEKLVRRGKRDFYRAIVKQGGEGVVTKDLQSVYVPGQRTRAWVKVKPRNTYDFIIVGFTWGSGKYSSQIGAIKYGVLSEGRPLEVGRSSGMTDDERRDMTNNPKKYLGKVAEFEAQELTRSGVMRHPSFIQLRPDLLPSEIGLGDYVR